MTCETNLLQSNKNNFTLNILNKFIISLSDTPPLDSNNNIKHHLGGTLIDFSSIDIYNDVIGFGGNPKDLYEIFRNTTLNEYNFLDLVMIHQSTETNPYVFRLFNFANITISDPSLGDIMSVYIIPLKGTYFNLENLTEDT